MATRLIIEDGRAVGAETSRGEIRAARAVVLACGSIQTPQLMMVSGLGPAAHLKEHGIEVIRDLPHLGQHLRDHVAAPVVWETHEPVAGWEICPFEATMMLQLDADAPAPDILFHFGLRVREKYDDGAPRHPRPGGEGLAQRDAREERGRGASLGPDHGGQAGHRPQLLFRSRRPRAAAPGPEADAQAGPDDGHAGAGAARKSTPAPPSRRDDEWRDYIRSVCETVYHPCCTAAIGRVVTPELKVMGIDGLFIADASVFASLITVNINAAVMMVAEKAADCILRRLTKALTLTLSDVEEAPRRGGGRMVLTKSCADASSPKRDLSRAQSSAHELAGECHRASRTAAAPAHSSRARCW